MPLRSKNLEVPDVSWSMDSVCRGPDANDYSARAGAADTIGIVRHQWRMPVLGPVVVGSARRLLARLVRPELATWGSIHPVSATTIPDECPISVAFHPKLRHRQLATFRTYCARVGLNGKIATR